MVVDDSPLFLEAAVQFLNDHLGLRVVGRARSGEEAIELVERLRPDVVIMVFAMPGLGGVEATRRIKARSSAPLVLMLSVHDNVTLRQAAEAARADGYLGKMDFVARIVDAVRALASPGPNRIAD